jgi:hypothetical protein
MANARSRSLRQHFNQILSLASIAYTFTTLHTIEYSMADHEGNNTETSQAALGNTTSQNPALIAAASSNNIHWTVELFEKHI